MVGVQRGKTPFQKRALRATLLKFERDTVVYVRFISLIFPSSRLNGQYDNDIVSGTF